MDFRQLSIYDFLKPNSERGNLEYMTNAELAREIGNATGLVFEPVYNGETYRAKYGKLTFEVNIGHIKVDMGNLKVGDPFVAVSVDGGMWGRGCPLETIEEAIRFFKKYMEEENDSNK